MHSEAVIQNACINPFAPATLSSARCFQCCHSDSEELDSTWSDLHNQAYLIYSRPDIITVSQ